MSTQIIQPNEKFSAIVLVELDSGINLPKVYKVNNNLFICTRPPFGMSEFWKLTIGTLETEDIEKARLFIIAKSISQRPDVLDRENKKLLEQANKFFLGLILSGTVRCGRPPVSLTGSNLDGEIDIRQIGKIEHPKVLVGCPLDDFNIDRIEQAAKLTMAMSRFFKSKDFRRIRRTINYFFDGIMSSRVYDRLHHFVRVIEGFIYPEIGKTRKQFISRTELFIGPNYHGLMGKLYDIRSRVEHVHSPFDVIDGKTKKEKNINLLKKAYLSESIARYCIINFCTNLKLWNCFIDETSIELFWKKSFQERRKIWGNEIDINNIIQRYKPENLKDNELNF